MANTLRNVQFPNPSGSTQGQMQVFGVATGASQRANRTSSTQRESAYRARKANARTAAAASGTIDVTR